MKKVLLLVFSLILWGCETIVDNVDISKFENIREKLVVNSFISPFDREIYVKVTKSIPINSERQIIYKNVYDPNLKDSVLVYVTPNNVTDAIVTLSSDNKQVTLKYNPTNQYYTISQRDIQVSSGKTYKLTVKSGNLQAEAETTVPKYRAVMEDLKVNQYETKLANGEYENVGYNAKFYWIDKGFEPNFYKIWGEMTFTLQIIKSKNGKEDTLKVPEYSYFNWIGDSFNRKGNYYSDKGFDGDVFLSPIGEINFDVNPDKYNARQITIASVNKLLVQLSTISKEFYDYQTSLSDHFEASNNPFSEPIPVYSNVKGGLGCFASFNKYEVVLDLRFVPKR
ncbi:MAG: DUF4249 domain-containing protein [Leadbetterella sp.]